MKKMEDFDGSQFSGNDENNNRSGVGINGDRSPNGFKALPNSATRKKILAERNGVSHCQNPNSPNSKSRKQPTSWSSQDPFRVSPCSFKISRSSHGQESVDDESASYDPMNNFLSPRPKFLRYGPKRRRENFLKREKMKDFDLETLLGDMGLDSQSDTEQGELSDCSCVSGNPSSLGEALPKEGLGESVEDNDGVDKDDDEEEMEMEEEEVGDRWGLKLALKFMLVLVVLVPSTAYISTMNSPTPPPAILAVRGLREESQRFGGELMKYFHGMTDFAVERRRVLFDGRKDMGAGLFGGELMKYLYEIRDFAVERGRVLFDGRKDMGVSLFELNKNNVDGGGEVENFKGEVKDFKEEMVVKSEDGDGKEENFKEEISDVMAVQGENGPILEEFETVEGFETEGGKSPFNSYQSFDEFFFQEESIVETEADNEDPEVQAGFGGSFERDKLSPKEVGNGDQVVSNGRDEFLLRLKENPLLAICSLVAVCASLVLTFYFKFKRSSVKTGRSANVLETMENPEVAEEAEPKRTPRRPPTPPRPHKSISPNVKLISELEIGNFGSPVQNFNYARSVRPEFAKEKIVQEEDVGQRIADLGLGSSTTPVRRSMRIRNRATSP